MKRRVLVSVVAGLLPLTIYGLATFLDDTLTIVICGSVALGAWFYIAPWWTE